MTTHQTLDQSRARTGGHTLRMLIGLAILAALTPAAPALAAGEAAKQVLDLAGVREGLCVHLGCGQEASPGLTADLAAESKMLVHGLALDDGAVTRARKAIEDRHLLGRASAEKIDPTPLPYLRDLANVVVIEDFALLAARGLAMEEVLRIVAPGGVVCLKKDGQWTKTVKPRPAGMDEWTHPAHGPDGNRVSADKELQFPIGLRWQDGVPMNFNLWAACRAWVIAGGRCFTVSTTEYENLSPASFMKHKDDSYLTARDAYNGLPLWKVALGTNNDGKALYNGNTAPLVTDGKRVYTYQKDRIVAFDAATGKSELTFPVKHPTVRLLLSQGVLVASGWEAVEAKGLWDSWTSKTVNGIVEAFDVATGQLKWSMPTPGQSLVAADGCVYMLLQTPVPTKEQFIAAVDILTGKERWRIPHTKISADPAMKLATAGLGVVVAVAEKKTKVVGKDGKETEQKTNDIKVLSAATGEQLWEIPKVGNEWAPLVDGMLWNGNKKYDAKTGEVKGTLTTGLNSPGCTPAAVVGSKFVTASRGCGYIDMAPDPGPDPAKPVTGSKYVQFGGARGGCLEGSVPANGMFYTSQNFCRCAPGQVQGFIAFGPSGSLPTSAEFETARPVEKGPAFGAVKDAPPAPGDWTTFMHDAQRSGCAATKLPEKLKVLWQSPAAKPPEGPLAAAWLARLRSCITAPVVAGGKVFAACVDDGQIVALDAATGKAAWHFTAGARIDSPPTIARGLCVFGCYDGWVYALRADDGQLAWRTRAAPMERRMVAFGQVESVWPALGSVIVRDNVVLATAGRTTESDGGLAVVALDAATGQHVWARGVAPGPNRVNDVLVAREDNVTVQHVMLDGKTGTPDTKSKAFKTNTLEGLVDGTWTRVGTRRSGTHNFGRACAELLVWNDETVFGYQCQPRMVFAMPRQQAEAEGKLTGKENTWQFNLPANHQAQGMVLLKANALEDATIVLGGMVCQPPENKVTGFVCVLSADKGKTLIELPLPAAPVYAGLAVTDGKVYASLEDGSVVCLGKAD